MIVPMKKLTLAALLEHREAILQALQSICAVQLISIGEGEQSSAAAEGRVQRLQSAEELLKEMLDDAGEYTELAVKVQQISGFTTLAEDVEAVKN